MRCLLGTTMSKTHQLSFPIAKMHGMVKPVPRVLKVTLASSWIKINASLGSGAHLSSASLNSTLGCLHHQSSLHVTGADSPDTAVRRQLERTVRGCRAYTSQLASRGQSWGGFMLTLIAVYRLVLNFPLANHKLPPHPSTPPLLPLSPSPLQGPMGLAQAWTRSGPALPCWRDILLLEVTASLAKASSQI